MVKLQQIELLTSGCGRAGSAECTTQQCPGAELQY